MRRIYVFILCIILAGFNLFSANIVVDGDLSDWTNRVGLTNVADPGGTTDDAQSRSDIVSNGIAVDQTTIYFYFKLEGNYEDSARYEIYSN
jgi:hypothetical protein